MVSSSRMSPLDEYVSDTDSSFTGDLEVKNESEDLEVLCEDVEMVKQTFIEGLTSWYKPIMLRCFSVHQKRNGILLCRDSDAKIATFNIFRKVIADKNGGDSNMQMAWFGGSKSQLRGILSLGFCGSTATVGGVGVHLSPYKYPIDCVGSATPQEDGVRYILLCQVILGKTETILPSSTQFYPSSVEFHSGVDNQLNPRRYVIWCCNMNTHILPQFLLLFRLPPRTETMKIPFSPFVSIHHLLLKLKNYLSRKKMAQLCKYYQMHKNHKLSRRQFIHIMRLIAGDYLLKSVIKSSFNIALA